MVVAPLSAHAPLWFSAFDPRRLLKSLIVLFGTAFVLKHLLVSGLYAPEGGWFRRIASTPATRHRHRRSGIRANYGYISFFALALYVAGLR